MGWTAIATAAAVAASAGAQIYTGRKQTKAVKAANASRQEEADKMFALQETEMKKQEERINEQKKEQQEALAAEDKGQRRDAAAMRRRKQEKGGGGRADTILTGAQGVQSPDSGPLKTLLGG